MALLRWPGLEMVPSHRGNDGPEADEEGQPEPAVVSAQQAGREDTGKTSGWH